MSTSRLGDFSCDITRARDLVGLGQAIGEMTNGLVDATDLYRAALVQAVAAWDRYVHGVVLDRAVEIMLGRLTAGASSKIGLPLIDVATLMNEHDDAARELTAKSIFAERLSKETYQRPDDVAAALAMVGIKSIWSAAFPDAQQAKIAIGVIIDRRNKIVHQCDYDPVTPGAVVPLTAQDVLDALSVVSGTVQTIDPMCI
ncbi:MAG: hypothetical protein JOZ48_04630 [Acidobacteriaceae bacterium]|nr:hypothetical protein [Acidobacteriaceae bacterium]